MYSYDSISVEKLIYIIKLIMVVKTDCSFSNSKIKGMVKKVKKQEHLIADIFL